MRYHGLSRLVVASEIHMQVTKAEVVAAKALRDFAVWLHKQAKSFQVWACQQYTITRMEYDRREKD